MDYLKNFLTNAIPIGIFIYSIIVGIPWLTITLVVFFWITIAASAMLPFIPPQFFFARKMSLESLSNTLALINKATNKKYWCFNILVDLTIAGFFMYFGYQILAIVYIIHIFGYLMMFNNIKMYVLNTFEVEAWSQVPGRLQQALDDGETEFSLHEMLDVEHPDFAWWKK